VTNEFVLDVSSTMPLVFHDESGPDTESLRQAFVAGAIAYVPTLWRYELSNSLWQGERRGRVTGAEIERALDLLYALPMEEVETWSADSLVAFARMFDLTAYDTAYLVLAQRLAIPLATRDAKLRQAAIEGDVELFGE